jgi:hypothetical protein
MLRNLLVEYLFKELVEVFLSHLVVEFSSMGLNDVTTAR